MAIRAPHVAGTFYPEDDLELRQFIGRHLQTNSPKKKAKAIVLPHAGYVYSGATALKVLSRIQIPELILMIGPNHFGVGSDFALYAEGQWQTPLGFSKIDTSLAQKILNISSDIHSEPETHAAEHSLEVIVPMLQFLNPKCHIMPLLIGNLDPDRSRIVAGDIGRALSALKREFLVVISSDMSHYESEEATRRKDRFALDAILNLDAEGLVAAAKKYRITMCGLMPVYMLLVMKDPLGIKKAELIEYTTSADATGDKTRVVGYAGFIFE